MLLERTIFLSAISFSLLLHMGVFADARAHHCCGQSKEDKIAFPLGCAAV
jgi:hypothetical protein